MNTSYFWPEDYYCDYHTAEEADGEGLGVRDEDDGGEEFLSANCFESISDFT